MAATNPIPVTPAKPSGVARVRKYLTAALVPAFPLLAHFLGVDPVHLSTQAAAYAFLVGEAAAFGVYVVPNK